jgi:hypothetical protein
LPFEITDFFPFGLEFGLESLGVKLLPVIGLGLGFEATLERFSGEGFYKFFHLFECETCPLAGVKAWLFKLFAHLMDLLGWDL